MNTWVTSKTNEHIIYKLFITLHYIEMGLGSYIENTSNNSDIKRVKFTNWKLYFTALFLLQKKIL